MGIRKRRPSKEIKLVKPGKRFAFLMLVINSFFAPGLGTIIAGNVKDGVIQLVILIIGGFVLGIFGASLALGGLTIVGIMMMLVGGLLMVIGWIWALVSSALILKASNYQL